ncbi:type II toxin-antitoxin system VapC family toxin [Mesorhizobium sp. LHD-90]|uniref:PIN domain-containing protein n=1 Tax=Mesorhizobium sp. LHD-90 TaxID=3071414 RepID=UPI0027DF17D4|nr:type II toxin-antitoxin system VapC family toxin [Mesorhizobium sp. LHD-90]MDQ6436944.1 type II toxin-antitoxin system VapC family toxin [Mesorhizobium sp. LHD-90]
MTAYVFDASALLAILRDEPGAEMAIARLPGALVPAVNWSETLMRGAEKGLPIDDMRSFLAAQQIELVPFDGDLAVATASLRPATKHAGLSFADRACIATAVERKATVVTADRIWATLDLPCRVELIR